MATVLPTKMDDDCYNMNHKDRGVALIFIHKIFESRLKMNPRAGSEVDEENLKATVKQLGFNDIRVYYDLKVEQVKRRIEQVSKENHSERDCVLVAVCTHGDEGLLYALDGRYPVEKLWIPFAGNKCPTLAGKPKIFLIQACRGERLDPGVLMTESDSVENYFKIPITADFLLVYSTIEGYYSWRNGNRGSYFVSSIADVFQKHHKKQELLEMLTSVNRQIAYEFESHVTIDEEMNGQKQMPCFTSMLTRKVYFNSDCPIRPEEEKIIVTIKEKTVQIIEEVDGGIPLVSLANNP